MSGEPEILILSGSPRPGGNSDTAARLFERSVSGLHTRVEAVRDHPIQACTGCGACSTSLDRRCVLDRDGDGLLRTIDQADALCIVAPIYFYHLPSQLKAHIDRAQPWWAASQEEKLPAPAKPAWVILIGARPKGDKLFSGSLLTLRYFLYSMNFAMREPLCLYGLDGPFDLELNPDASERIRCYARHVAIGK